MLYLPYINSSKFKGDTKGAFAFEVQEACLVDIFILLLDTTPLCNKCGYKGEASHCSPTSIYVMKIKLPHANRPNKIDYVFICRLQEPIVS